MVLSAVTPTDQEQYLLELINRTRMDPLGEVQRNGAVTDLNAGLAPNTLTAAAKQPLAFDSDLLAAARAHSQWMLETDQFAHTGANGSSARDRMTSAGYDFTGRWSWSENIAWWGTTGRLSVNDVLDIQHDGLFASASHRINTLNGALKQVGVGIIIGEFQGYNAAMTTQNFATSGSATYLTGVLYDDAVVNDDFYTVGEGLANVAIQAVRQDGAVFTTQSYASGGYSLALTPGSYTINFSGGELGRSVTRTVTIGELNLKLDLATDQPLTLVPAVAPVPAAPAPLFNPLRYLASHADLIAAFGFNPVAALDHYLRYGQQENRATQRFSGASYLAGYDDLIAAFGFDPAKATEHYIRHGVAEGRNSDSFSGLSYLASYDDLLTAFGLDPDRAAEHYVRHGATEGRSRDSFDELTYLASYGDLIEAFGFDLNRATEHYVRHGMGEGRSPSGFDAATYLSRYADLQVAFGSDLAQAAEHFIRHGYAEGRTDIG